AYGFPDRKRDSAERLPVRDWLPLFLRCRELDPTGPEPITRSLVGIADRAEMDNMSPMFAALVSGSLRDGTALLLIDGVDEIAEDTLRAAFLHQLRVFLAMYPTIHCV